MPRRRGYSGLRLLVLRILSEKPLHGYALMKEIGRLLGREPSPGTLYPLLKEMLREGLVEARVSGIGGRVVKTYYITEKGRQLLSSERSEAEDFMKLLDGIRIAEAEGLGLDRVMDSLARLIRLLPRLGDEDRARVAEFLRKIVLEAEELAEELEASLGDARAGASTESLGGGVVTG